MSVNLTMAAILSIRIKKVYGSHAVEVTDKCSFLMRIPLRSGVE